MSDAEESEGDCESWKSIGTAAPSADGSFASSIGCAVDEEEECRDEEERETMDPSPLRLARPQRRRSKVRAHHA